MVGPTTNESEGVSNKSVGPIHHIIDVETKHLGTHEVNEVIEVAIVRVD